MSGINQKLFIDKHRPSSYNQIKFNQTISDQLTACAQLKNITHLIIKGPKGCGKKTFANLFIKAKYQKESLRMKQLKFEIKHASKTIELQLLYSNYHYQIDPSMHGVYDRLIMQGFIKDILQNKPICAEIPYHSIIIENADKLTLEAQQSLRRTLEKNMDNCRFIFIVDQESNLIEPLMSRCALFRLAAPTHDEIKDILKDICAKENIEYLPEQLQQIVNYAKRNLSTAINLLQYLHVCLPQYLKENRLIDFTDIIHLDTYLQNILNLITDSITTKTILSIRSLLYDLLVHCVEPIDILKKLFKYIFEHFEKEGYSNQMKYQLIDILAKYENTLKQGSKPIYHLEGFIVSVLNLLS